MKYAAKAMAAAPAKFKSLAVRMSKISSCFPGALVYTLERMPGASVFGRGLLQMIYHDSLNRGFARIEFEAQLRHRRSDRAPGWIRRAIRLCSARSGWSAAAARPA